MSIYSELNYDAVGVGPADLRLADHFFKTAAEAGLTVVDASPQPCETMVPYVIKNVGGVRIGIVSFGGIALDAMQDQFAVRRAMYGAYKTAREQSDLLIVLDQGNVISRDWLDRNSARLGPPDVVIGGISRMGLPQPQVVGRTHIVPTHLQGKAFGYVDVEIVPGQSVPKVFAHTVQLEMGIPEDPEIAARIQEELLKTAPPGTVVSAENPASHSSPNVHNSDSAYYPPQLCKSCHAKEYEDWQATPHARAIKTLLDANRAIPECLNCHSEMFRRSNRVVMPRDNVGGVECATCHFDSLPHGMERADVTDKKKVNPQLCLTCHTRDRSPEYEEQSYMQRVSHKDAPQSGGHAQHP